MYELLAETSMNSQQNDTNKSSESHVVDVVKRTVYLSIALKKIDVKATTPTRSMHDGIRHLYLFSLNKFMPDNWRTRWLKRLIKYLDR